MCKQRKYVNYIIILLLYIILNIFKTKSKVLKTFKGVTFVSVLIKRRFFFAFTPRTWWCVVKYSNLEFKSFY